MTAPRPAWVLHALAESSRWVAGAPPALQSRLARVQARVASGQGAASVEGALTARLATPGFALTEAYRRDLDLPDGPLLRALGEGALGLYFYLRIQDDVIDEPGTYDASYLYAAEVFAGASAEGFARAVGDQPVFWSFRRAALDELAAISAWEIDTYRALDLAVTGAHAEQHAAELGSKLIPMAIPLAALAAATNRPRSLAWIGPFARALGRALQIANDLLNARDDHVTGRLTPSLAALYAGGRVSRSDDAFRVWPALAGDPALDRMLRAARMHVEAAASLAADSEAPALAAATTGIGAVLDEIAPRLLKLALGVRP